MKLMKIKIQILIVFHHSNLPALKWLAITIDSNQDQLYFLKFNEIA